MPRFVDQDALCAQMFDLSAMSQWEYKRNVINTNESSLTVEANIPL